MQRAKVQCDCECHEQKQRICDNCYKLHMPTQQPRKIFTREDYDNDLSKEQEIFFRREKIRKILASYPNITLQQIIAALHDEEVKKAKLEERQPEKMLSIATISRDVEYIKRGSREWVNEMAMFGASWTAQQQMDRTQTQMTKLQQEIDSGFYDDPTDRINAYKAINELGRTMMEIANSGALKRLQLHVEEIEKHEQELTKATEEGERDDLF